VLRFGGGDAVSELRSSCSEVAVKVASEQILVSIECAFALFVGRLPLLNALVIRLLCSFQLFFLLILLLCSRFPLRIQEGLSNRFICFLPSKVILNSHGRISLLRNNLRHTITSRALRQLRPLVIDEFAGVTGLCLARFFHVERFGGKLSVLVALVVAE